MVKNFALERLALDVRWSGKSALEAHRVKTLDSNGEAFEKKRFFAWVAGHQGDAAAKVSKKGESFGVDGTKSLAFLLSFILINFLSI